MGILDIFKKPTSEEDFKLQNTVNTDDIDELVVDGVVENIISDTKSK